MFTATEIRDYAKTITAAFETTDEIQQIPVEDRNHTWTGGFQVEGMVRDGSVEATLWLYFDFSDSFGAGGYCRLTDELDPTSLVITADPVGDPEGTEGI